MQQAVACAPCITHSLPPACADVLGSYDCELQASLRTCSAHRSQAWIGNLYEGMRVCLGVYKLMSCAVREITIQAMVTPDSKVTQTTCNTQVPDRQQRFELTCKLHHAVLTLGVIAGGMVNAIGGDLERGNEVDRVSRLHNHVCPAVQEVRHDLPS